MRDGGPLLCAPISPHPAQRGDPSPSGPSARPECASGAWRWRNVQISGDAIRPSRRLGLGRGRDVGRGLGGAAAPGVGSFLVAHDRTRQKAQGRALDSVRGATRPCDLSAFSVCRTKTCAEHGARTPPPLPPFHSIRAQWRPPIVPSAMTRPGRQRSARKPSPSRF